MIISPDLVGIIRKLANLSFSFVVHFYTGKVREITQGMEGWEMGIGFADIFCVGIVMGVMCMQMR